MSDGTNLKVEALKMQCLSPFSTVKNEKVSAVAVVKNKKMPVSKQ